MTIAVVGDALLDRDVLGTVQRICPDAPAPVLDAGEERSRCGGAALAACLLAGAGQDVVLVTALAEDAAGEELRSLLDAAGVEVVAAASAGPTPEKIRVRARHQSLLRIDRGGSVGAPGPIGEAGRRAIAGARGVLVADYGRGLAERDDVRAAIGDAIGTARSAVVWDPHPRGAAPVRGIQLATPSAAEAALLSPATRGDSIGAAAVRAEALVARWAVGAVAVTLGERGALLAGHGGPPLVVPAVPAGSGDPCGAGDRFAGAATVALAGGAVLSEAVEAAVVAASEFVARGGAAAVADARTGPVPRPAAAWSDPDGVVAAARAAGRTVVATGGCFDLLHAGHVAMLRAARRLGDCLVVCLNSDASVRRLKGPDRPLQPAPDRAAVLAALDCVDAVAVFDEDTPEAVLRRLRPDLFVKGGDYAVSDLPEAATVAQWGGQAVLVPYLGGRSTTRLIQEARRATL